MTKGKILSIVGIVILVGVISGATKYLLKNGFSNDAEKNVDNYFTDTSSWKEFNSPVGKFRAEFPTYPEHEAESVKIPDSELTIKYDTYTSEKTDGTIYFVNTAVYPPEVDTSNPETNLEGALNGTIASSPKNKLVSSSLTYSNGYRAMDFLIEADGDFIKGKVIMADHTLYQIMVVYENKNYSETDYNKFMSSFTIQK